MSIQKVVKTQVSTAFVEVNSESGENLGLRSPLYNGIKLTLLSRILFQISCLIPRELR